MGCCFSKTKETTGLEEPILTVDEIYKPEKPIFSMEEYNQVVGTAKKLRKKYDPNKNQGGILSLAEPIGSLINKSHL